MTSPAIFTFCLLLQVTLVNFHLLHVSLYCILKPQPGPPSVSLSFLKLRIQDLSGAGVHDPSFPGGQVTADSSVLK